MKGQNKYRLLSTLSRGVPQGVGDFFEGLGKVLLDGSDNCPYDEADFVRWDLDLGVEVKARATDHSFHIPASQLLSHVAAAQGFPFRRYLYCLFSYSVRAITPEKKGKRVSLLAKCKTASEIRFVLAQQPLTLYVLDISIMEAMHKLYGSVRNPLDRNLGNVMELRHRTLQRFASNSNDRSGADALLRELEVKPEKMQVINSCAFLPFRDGLFEYPLHISMTQVIPRTFCRQLEETIFPFLPRERSCFVIA